MMDYCSVANIADFASLHLSMIIIFAATLLQQLDYINE
jgi:hypothetical protein